MIELESRRSGCSWCADLPTSHMCLWGQRNYKSHPWKRREESSFRHLHSKVQQIAPSYCYSCFGCSYNCSSSEHCFPCLLHSCTCNTARLARQLQACGTREPLGGWTGSCSGCCCCCHPACTGRSSQVPDKATHVIWVRRYSGFKRRAFHATYGVLVTSLLAILLVIGILAVAVLANTYVWMKMYRVVSATAEHWKFRYYFDRRLTYVHSCTLGRSTLIQHTRWQNHSCQQRSRHHCCKKKSKRRKGRAWSERD